MGLLGSALGLDPLGGRESTTEESEAEEDEEDYDSPLASVSYFDYDYNDDISEEDFNNTEEVTTESVPELPTLPPSVSTTTTKNPINDNQAAVLEEFTAENNLCCCLPVASCPSVSVGNLVVEMDNESNNSSTTSTASPSRVIFRTGLGSVGGCAEGEVGVFIYAQVD